MCASLSLSHYPDMRVRNHIYTPIRDTTFIDARVCVCPTCLAAARPIYLSICLSISLSLYVYIYIYIFMCSNTYSNTSNSTNDNDNNNKASTGPG